MYIRAKSIIECNYGNLTLKGAVDKLRREHPGHEPEEINDEAVLSICLFCNYPVMGSNGELIDMEEGEWAHYDCLEAAKEKK